MEINAATPLSNSPNFVDRDSIGVSGLTAENFLELLITQLQHQDPTEPVGNEEILNQLAMMKNLQSNSELSDTLSKFTSNLSVAASFIGKTITADLRDENGSPQTVSGAVDRAFVEDGTAYVGVGELKIPLEQITMVGAASDAA
jgi:flagellar basal-body rod modification protein FlgD